MITVKKVSEGYIPVIKALAHKTWQVAYKYILSPEQMAYMLELFYSEASLQKQMQQGHQFILAFIENDAIGFASYSRKSLHENNIYRLHKLYIDPEQQGKGIGKILLDYVCNDIKPAGAQILELTVNRYNKALSFYQKNGFEIISEEDTDIGNGYFMNDYVMRKPLTPKGE